MVNFLPIEDLKKPLIGYDIYCKSTVQLAIFKDYAPLSFIFRMNLSGAIFDMILKFLDRKFKNDLVWFFLKTKRYRLHLNWINR